MFINTINVEKLFLKFKKNFFILINEKFLFKKMSEPKINNTTFIDPYESDDSQDPNYIPSQTPESEDYTSYESSSLETESESDYSIACSDDCSSFSSLE